MTVNTELLGPERLRDLGNGPNTYTIGVDTAAGGTAGGTAVNYADNNQWTINDGSWKVIDSTVSWTDPNAERIKVIEEALVVLADMMKGGSGETWAKVEMFLEIVKHLRTEEEEKQEFEDHIDKELFEIKDDF
jgi:hypothetical protein